MEIGGDALRPAGVHEAMARGIAMVPKERAVEGLIDAHSIRANIGLANLSSLTRRGFIIETLERQVAASGIEMFRIKCNSQVSPVRSLSGGNKQKVLLAKWFHTNPRLMLLNNPTRGVDVGVKFEIYELLDRLRRSRDLAILMASEDMSEIIRISDTVVTLRHGRVSGVFRGADQITETNLINAML
jgi:ABC-type sugar transport system ATPase subunit